MTGRCSYRGFFQKTGRLRFLSHHDLIRLFSRVLRRAGLPLRFTEGFTPRPSISFPLALAVGVESLEEILEIELTESVEPGELGRRLNRELPGGLRFTRVEPVPPGARGRVTAVDYRFELDPAPGDLAERVKAVLGRERIPVRRLRGGREREVDLRAWIREARAEGTDLWCRVAVSPDGTARPGEILQAFDVPEAAVRRVVKLRTHLES